MLAELPVTANTDRHWQYHWISSLSKLPGLHADCLVADDLTKRWQPRSNTASGQRLIVILLAGPKQLQIADTRVSDYLPTAFLNAALLEKCLDGNLKAASLEQQIAHLKERDAVTGLATQSLFQKQLGYSLEKARRNDALFAVMAIRIDNFSDLLGKLGHAGSEPILQSVAQRLTTTLHKKDLIARGQSGEFLVLIEGINTIGDAGRHAHAILQSMQRHFEIGEEDLSPTASIGIGCYPESGTDIASLMAATQAALDLASETGDEFRMFNEEVANISRRHFEIEQALPEALRKRELEVFYQPQCDIESGKVCGAEALLRWYRPTLGEVAAEEFIPVAESSDAILDIGEWVLRESLSEMEKWFEYSKQPPRLAINVSGRQFRNKKILFDVEMLLENTAIPPGHLELELTERIFIENIESHRNVFKRLKSLGISIALDDFGTKYSSLNYLRYFPVDALKIDKTFTNSLPDSKGDADIVRAIIAMGHSLGMRVIAEGIERESQLEFLHDHKCDEVQGHLFSPGLPADQFIKLVDKDSNQDISYVDAVAVPDSNLSS